jgi:hypothetical protein
VPASFPFNPEDDSIMPPEMSFSFHQRYNKYAKYRLFSELSRRLILSAEPEAVISAPVKVKPFSFRMCTIAVWEGCRFIGWKLIPFPGAAFQIPSQFIGQ